MVEVTENHRLKHLYHASGGDWGGKKINEQIFQIFTDIFGVEVMKKFKEMKAEVLEMENDIEMKKRDLKIDGRLHVRLLPALTSLCEETSDIPYNMMIKNSSYRKLVGIRGGGKILFEPSLVNDIFESVVGEIAKHVKTVLEAPATIGVKTIILVGGFAECDIINEYMRKKFSTYDVKIPLDPGLAVLKGAVKFGHDQGIIAARVCNYTYGLESNRYLLATDPEEKRQWIGDKQMCTGVFEKLITIGDMVKVGQEVEKEVLASTADMTKMTLNIYRTKQPNPQFITDEGCELFGEMMVEMPSTKGGQKRSVTVSMLFGETEILFSGQDQASTRRCELTLQLPVYG